MNQLKTGSTLQNGKYRIEKVLGQGGFGITYEGVQCGLNRHVAIKEFFMKDYCERDDITNQVTAPNTGGINDFVSAFREKFIKEAQIIASMDEAPHTVRIYDIFEENGTAYYVMQFIDGGSLGQLVKQHGPMPESRAVSIIRQTAKALSYLHARKTMHLDVKPSNILLRKNDEGIDDVVLIDFGVSKHYDSQGHQTTSTPVGLSKGYAPFEQYREGGVGQFSPSADVYSLGATLYFLLTGKTPPEAASLISEPLECPPNISSQMWKVISRAMALRPRDRYQTMKEMADALNNTLTKPEPESIDTIPQNDSEATVVEPSSPTKVANPVDSSEETKLSETAKKDKDFKGYIIWIFIVFIAISILFARMNSCDNQKPSYDALAADSLAAEPYYEETDYDNAYADSIFINAMLNIEAGGDTAWTISQLIEAAQLGSYDAKEQLRHWGFSEEDLVVK